MDISIYPHAVTPYASRRNAPSRLGFGISSCVIVPRASRWSMRFLGIDDIIEHSDAMINVTKLYCGGTFPGDRLRYAASGNPAPVVAWNCTQRCNLKCRHCYSNAGEGDDGGELSSAEAREMISDLARYGVPVLLFSGGEPL